MLKLNARRVVYGLVAALLAALGGAALRKRRRPQSVLLPSSVLSLEDTQPIRITALADPASSALGIGTRWAALYALLPLLRYSLGIGCFAGAQALLLGSYNPVMPLLLFIGGLALLLPALERVVLPQAEAQIPRWHLAVLLTFMLLSWWLPTQLPPLTAPLLGVGAEVAGPLYALLHTWPPSLFLLLTLPAVYLLGAWADVPLTGLFAAGLLAVSLYTLALGQVGGIYNALVFFGAVYLTLLFYIRRHPSLGGYALALLALGIGSFVSPLLLYLVLLLPLLLLFQSVEEKRVMGVRLALVILLLLGYMLLRPVASADFQKQAGYSPLIASLDGVFNSLLVFNLTSDPSPLHGIINRPAFAPLIAALFFVGVVAWIVRLLGGRRWSDGLLPAALLAGALPSALLLTLPPSTPHLGRAALLLPVAVIFAGWALRLLVVQIEAHLGRWALPIIGILFLGLLLNSAQDADNHYRNSFLPIYERAAPTASDLQSLP